MNAVVVGAGLFGSVIAAALEKAGAIVTVIDSMEERAGSLPSACLMKPSWFSSMGKDQYEPALELLDRTCGVEEFEFTVRPSGLKTKVLRIDPSKHVGILGGRQFRHDKVVEVMDGYVRTASEAEYRTDLVVVCAGVWCRNLLPELPNIRPMRGVAYQRFGQVKENIISVWAPYKQLVAFNDTEHSVWVGDGTAILDSNWSPDRERKSLERCHRVLEALECPPQNIIARHGLRPYIKDAKPCLLQRISPRLVVATGGAKNGTIAAGWAAHEIVRQL